MPMTYSMPPCAPLFQAPPFAYRGYRKVSVICRSQRDAIAAMLPPELEPASDLIEVFCMDVPDAGTLGTYLEGGITVQVTHKGAPGGHVLYEYVTTDDSLVAGREIWGYPKKLCTLDWSEENGRVSAQVHRRGHELISIEFTPGGEEGPRPTLQPRFQVKLIPSADGGAPDVHRVIRNELAAGTIHQKTPGTAEVRLGGWAQDPLDQLPILEVVSAEFLVADFTLGYAKAL